MQVWTAPRGAVYVPARAFNSYQAWRDYSSEERARDFGFARRLKLDALRLWLSYEFWCESRGAFEGAFEDLLSAAARHGLKIMPSLFEGVGLDATAENLRNVDPLTAACTVSPGFEVVEDRSKWGGPAAFVEWFMGRYRDDERLLAIEVMNEPGMMRGEPGFGLARFLFDRASAGRGKVRLTVGCNELLENMYYVEAGLDVLQYHNNFPASAAVFEEGLARAASVQRVMGKPVWITEWQRVRRGEAGWDGKEARADERGPGYATLVPSVEKYGLGNFFWSLMLKPAYLTKQRRAGTFNGVFHEDGTVVSLADARALAGDAFEGEERGRM